MHGADEPEIGQPRVRRFLGREAARHDSGCRAACGERGVRDDAHEPFARPAVDQTDALLGQQPSNAVSHFTTVFTRAARSSSAGRAQSPGEARPGQDIAGRPAEILALFAGQQELTASGIAQATGLSKAMTNRYLARLVAEGRLIATAPPSSRNRAYRLPAL